MPRETVAAKCARATAVLDGLRILYPDAKTELDFVTPFQLVIATLLSAQAAPEDVEPYIRTIGLYRNKANETSNSVPSRRLRANELPVDSGEYPK